MAISAVVEIGPRAGERQRLNRLGARSEETDELRIAGGRDDLAVADGDGVDAVARLDGASTADGYADRLDGEKANSLAARRAVASPGLPEALVRSDDQPGRLAGVGPGAAAGRRARARRQRVRGRAAGNGRVPALPALRAAGRRLGRPAAAASDPHRHGPLSRAVPRLDTGCVPLRRADHLAALRRRLSRRHLHTSSSTSRTSRTCLRSSARTSSWRGTRCSRCHAMRPRSAVPAWPGCSLERSRPRTPSCSTRSASSDRRDCWR